MFRDPSGMTKTVRCHINGSPGIQVNYWGPLVCEFMEKEFKREKKYRKGCSQTCSCPNVKIHWLEKEIETVTRKKIRSGSLLISECKCHTTRHRYQETKLNKDTRVRRTDFTNSGAIGDRRNDIADFFDSLQSFPLYKGPPFMPNSSSELEYFVNTVHENFPGSGPLMGSGDVSTQTHSRKESLEQVVNNMIEKATVMLKEEINKAIDKKFEPLQNVITDKHSKTDDVQLDNTPIITNYNQTEEEISEKDKTIEDIKGKSEECLMKLIPNYLLEKNKFIYSDVIPSQIQEIYFNKIDWGDCLQLFEKEKINYTTRGTNTKRSTEAEPKISESDLGSLQSSKAVKEQPSNRPVNQSYCGEEASEESNNKEDSENVKTNSLNSFPQDHTRDTGSLGDMNKFLYIVLETLRRLSEEKKKITKNVDKLNIKIANFPKDPLYLTPAEEEVKEEKWVQFEWLINKIKGNKLEAKISKEKRDATLYYKMNRRCRPGTTKIKNKILFKAKKGKEMYLESQKIFEMSDLGKSSSLLEMFSKSDDTLSMKKALKFRETVSTENESHTYPVRVLTSSNRWTVHCFEKGYEKMLNEEINKYSLHSELNLPNAMAFEEDDWLLTQPENNFFFLNNLNNEICQTCMTKTIDNKMLIFKLNNLKQSDSNFYLKQNDNNNNNTTSSDFQNEVNVGDIEKVSEEECTLKGYAAIKYKPNRNFSHFKIRNENEYLNLSSSKDNIKHSSETKLFQSKGLYKCFIKKKFFPENSKDHRKMDEWIHNSKYKKYLLNSCVSISCFQKGKHSSISVMPILFKNTDNFKKYPPNYCRESSTQFSKPNCLSRVTHPNISLENTFLSVIMTPVAYKNSDETQLVRSREKTENENSKCILKKLCNWSKNNERESIYRHLKNIYKALYTDQVTKQVYESVMVISQQLRDSPDKKKEFIINTWLEICGNKRETNKIMMNIEWLLDRIVTFKDRMCHINKTQTPEPELFPSLPPNTVSNIREIVIKKYAKEIINYIADPKCFRINLKEYENKVIDEYS